MFYTAIIHREGKRWLADFPDAPGCQTFADSRNALAVAAAEALTGWLEAHLIDGECPPRPALSWRTQPWKMRHPCPPALRVHVPAALAVALSVRWTRRDLGMSQLELAQRAGMTQQQIARLENPGHSPSLKTIDRVAAALGAELDISLAKVG